MEGAPLTFWLQRLRKAVAAIDGMDVALVAGLGLLGYGAHLVYPPAAWLTVGGVLVWLGLPTRPFPIVFVRDATKAKE